MRKLLEQTVRRLRAGERVVWCVILHAEGSTPREAGAKMALFSDGSVAGTVGGGAVEHQALEFARTLGNRAALRDYDLYSGGSQATGMICGGRVRIGFFPLLPRNLEWAEALLDCLEQPLGRWLVLELGPEGALSLRLERDAEPVASRDRLPPAPRAAFLPDGSLRYTEPLDPDGRVYIFGCGHVSRALAPLLLTLGFPVTVLDERPEQALPERFPGAAVLLGSFEPLPASVQLSRRDYAVVMTPEHQRDLAVLRQLLPTEARYIGCIGSRRKTAYVNQALLEEGFPQEAVQRIHAPIGLPIRARTPEEIAVSIAAELILCRAGGLSD